MTLSAKKPVRIWVDGCFDLMHFGHANALRQAKSMGDFLVVGVHSDAEIEKHKGPTVMKEKERYAAVEACKWVDLVVPDAPYFTTVEMLDKYNCDFCVHGDDVTTLADGTDCYMEVKRAGRYKECKRTQGVSTTELVGRMLLMSSEHLHRRPEKVESGLLSPGGTTVISEDLNGGHIERSQVRGFAEGGRVGASENSNTAVSHFLPTSKRIVQFSNGREPGPEDRVVYVDGGFDLFHIGHIEFLRAARALGDYLLVGIHSDSVINQIKGRNYPIMNLQERVLSVLSCKFVDEVIIGAPYSVTNDVLERVYSVSLVVHGSTQCDQDVCGKDPYEIPKERGIFKTVDSLYPDLTGDVIIERILENRKMYEDRNRRKAEKAKAEAEMEMKEKLLAKK